VADPAATAALSPRRRAPSRHLRARRSPHPRNADPIAATATRPVPAVP